MCALYIGLHIILRAHSSAYHSSAYPRAHWSAYCWACSFAYHRTCTFICTLSQARIGLLVARIRLHIIAHITNSTAYHRSHLFSCIIRSHIIASSRVSFVCTSSHAHIRLLVARHRLEQFVLRLDVRKPTLQHLHRLLALCLSHLKPEM
eukprot:2775230-Rhodomonas_salina.2